MTGIIEFIEQVSAYLSSDEFTRLSIAAITIMGVFVTFKNRSRSLEAYSAKKSIALKETQYSDVQNKLIVLENYNKELMSLLEKQNLLFAEAFLNSKLNAEAKGKIAKIVADMKKPSIDGEVFNKAKQILENPVIEQTIKTISNLSKLKGE
jgi:Tfp pilus assembly protein PilO